MKKREREKNLHTAPTMQVYHSGVDLIRAHCQIQHCHNMLVFDFPGVCTLIFLSVCTYTRLFITETVMQLLLSAFSRFSLHPWYTTIHINTLNNKERWRAIKEMKEGLNVNESEQGSGWQTQFDTEPNTLLKHNTQSHPIKVSSLLDATISKTFLAPISIHIPNSHYYIKSALALLTPEKL